MVGVHKTRGHWFTGRVRRFRGDLKTSCPQRMWEVAPEEVVEAGTLTSVK